MLQLDARDHAHGSVVEDVGVVRAPTEPRLDHNGVAPLVGEVTHACRKSNLYERRAAEGGVRAATVEHLCDEWLHAEHEVGEAVRRHERTIDVEALNEGLQVGLGVEAGAQAGGTQDRGDHRRRRAFPGAAGDVHGGARELRVAEAPEKDADAVLERLLDGHDRGLVPQALDQVIAGSVVSLEGHA